MRALRGALPRRLHSDDSLTLKWHEARWTKFWMSDSPTDARAAFNPQPPRPSWGIRPPPRKDQSMVRPILVAPAPNQVVIPLRQCLGMAAETLVTPGQKVQAGEPIACAICADPGVPGPKLHASVSGTVAAIEPRPVPAGKREETCIIIDGDGRDESYDGYMNLGDPLSMPTERLRELIAEAGIVGLGGALFSTAGKLAADHEIHTLILNGTECEPYITCDEILMRDHAHRILHGARIMMHALGATQTIVGIESDMPSARVAIWDAIEAENLDDFHVSVVTAKYPAGGENQLIELIMGREVPEGRPPNDIGIVCQNVGTAAAVADFFRDGRPLISRIVTISGRGIAEPINIDARIGTPMSELFDLAGGANENATHLIMGGPMMGKSLPDTNLPVTKATNCLILMLTREISPTRQEMPCIRCGECSQVCPAHLLPQQLLTAARRQDMNSLAELGVSACIECGCCDFVCPSHILLTDRFIDAKLELRVHTEEVARAGHARQRFEARAARLEQKQETREHELSRQVDSAGAAETLDAIMARVNAKDDHRDDHRDDNGHDER
jgi:electron transport complex protein RnfC